MKILDLWNEKHSNSNYRYATEKVLRVEVYSLQSGTTTTDIHDWD